AAVGGGDEDVERDQRVLLGGRLLEDDHVPPVAELDLHVRHGVDRRPEDDEIGQGGAGERIDRAAVGSGGDGVGGDLAAEERQLGDVGGGAVGRRADGRALRFRERAVG